MKFKVFIDSQPKTEYVSNRSNHLFFCLINFLFPKHQSFDEKCFDCKTIVINSENSESDDRQCDRHRITSDNVQWVCRLERTDRSIGTLVLCHNCRQINERMAAAVRVGDRAFHSIIYEPTVTPMIIMVANRRASDRIPHR